MGSILTAAPLFFGPLFFFFTAHHPKEPFGKMPGNNTANGTYNILNVVKINIVFMDALEMQ